MNYLKLTHPSLFAQYGPLKPKTHYVFAIKWSSLKNMHTIHGLWPNYNFNPTNPNWDVHALTSSNCYGLDSHTLKEFLTQYWESDITTHTNQAFWQHEYKKHGRCMPQPWFDLCNQKHSKINTEDYLRLTCILYRKIPFRDKIDLNEHHQVEFHLDYEWNLQEIRSLKKNE